MGLVARLKPDPRTLFSGVLIVLAFPKWNFFWLIWFCLVPWFAALERTPNLKAAFAQGVWLSIVMTVGGFYWVASVLHEFGGLPWAVAGLGLFLFSLAGQTQFLIFAPIYRALFERRLVASVSTAPWRALGLTCAVAALYSGGDWLIPKLFVDTLGHAFHTAPNIRQIADIGGPPLLTFLVYVVNDALWGAWKRLRARTEPKISVPSLAFCALFVGSAVIYGVIRNREWDALLASPSNSVQVGIIQGNIGDIEKLAAERGVYAASNNVLKVFTDLSESALKLEPRPEILVWPETSYPSTFRNPSGQGEKMRDEWVERFVREHGVPLLFGGYDQAHGLDYNALFLLFPDGALATYRKNILLLFGEYLPLSETFTSLRQAFPQVGNFGRGIGPDVLDARSFKLGPVICYEALFPSYVIPAARKGSQMILNVTNDSWFGDTAEPWLHLALVSFRSIETRLPQVRSTNTGVSGLILPNGELIRHSVLFQPEILNIRVPLIPPGKTLMVLWGDWFGGTAFLAALLALGIPLARTRKRSHL